MTNQRKIEILTKAIDLLLQGSVKGICCALLDAMRNDEMIMIPKPYSSQSMLLFFDLLKFKPKQPFNGVYWFCPGECAERIKFLEMRINELLK